MVGGNHPDLAQSSAADHFSDGTEPPESIVRALNDDEVSRMLAVIVANGIPPTLLKQFHGISNMADRRTFLVAYIGYMRQSPDDSKEALRQSVSAEDEQQIEQPLLIDDESIKDEAYIRPPGTVEKLRKQVLHRFPNLIHVLHPQDWAELNRPLADRIGIREVNRLYHLIQAAVLRYRDTHHDH
jgi:hypothetical protein